jgi:hypothetical protein
MITELLRADETRNYRDHEQAGFDLRTKRDVTNRHAAVTSGGTGGVIVLGC